VFRFHATIEHVEHRLFAACVIERGRGQDIKRLLGALGFTRNVVGQIGQPVAELPFIRHTILQERWLVIAAHDSACS
jgi:hypothetical protein